MVTGRIELIVGPMFSGKTTEMIRRIRRLELANHKCVVIKYAKDNRYDLDGSIVRTHDKTEIAAVPSTSLSDVSRIVEYADAVGIDEGQFFIDIADFCEALANSGKIVIVSALNGTYTRDLFGNVFKLLPIAEKIISLNAVCMRCYAPASFSRRTTDDKSIELIGGKEAYESVCRGCFTRP